MPPVLLAVMFSQDSAIMDWKDVFIFTTSGTENFAFKTQVMNMAELPSGNFHLGNADTLRQLTGCSDIPQAAAVVMQYTGYTRVSARDAPNYACVSTKDGIANRRTMQNRLT